MIPGHLVYGRNDPLRTSAANNRASQLELWEALPVRMRSWIEKNPQLFSYLERTNVGLELKEGGKNYWISIRKLTGPDWRLTTNMTSPNVFEPNYYDYTSYLDLMRDYEKIINSFLREKEVKKNPIPAHLVDGAADPSDTAKRNDRAKQKEIWKMLPTGFRDWIKKNSNLFTESFTMYDMLTFGYKSGNKILFLNAEVSDAVLTTYSVSLFEGGDLKTRPNTYYSWHFAVNDFLDLLRIM